MPSLAKHPIYSSHANKAIGKMATVAHPAGNFA